MFCLKKLPVTAVKLLDKYVLTGIGGDLAVFDLDQSIQLKQLNVLDNRTIHGIFANLDLSLLCILGGKHIAVLQIDIKSPTLGLQILKRWQASDWILCGRWVQDTMNLVLLSAHNVVSLWNHASGCLLSQVACTEKCILYSGTLLGRSIEDLVVIAGTVFQQVIIWTAAIQLTVSQADDNPVIHKLQGHKGVIFSVRYDSPSNLITSTSDDRTVRVWTVSPANGRLDTAADWTAASVSLSYTIFGHTARVWQSHVLSDRKILSVGEDSQLCLWQDGGTSVYKRQAHQNGGIWCMDVDETRGVVVTGGVDGGISVWPLQPPVIVPHSLPIPPSTPRMVALLSRSRVLVNSEVGSLLSYEDGAWSTVFYDSRFSSYCVLQPSPRREHVGLASINGHIVVLKGADFTTVVDIHVNEGRIFALHWLDEQTLLSCHNQGKLYVWHLTSSGFERVGTPYLPACKEWWTTAAVMVDNTIVYGDRSGNIHSTSLTGSGGHTVRTVKRSNCRRLGVCSLTVHDGQVWSTSRHRKVRRYTVRGDNHSLSVATSSRLPFDWLATVIPSTPFGTAILCFHEKRVVLWSVDERKELLSVPCGGGHRSWSCLLEAGCFYFTYLKDKTAHLLECPLLKISRPAIMAGFHPKEINSIAWISGNWIVSGGEDGTVRLSNCANNWRTPFVEHHHLSSVRSVHVEPSDRRMWVFSAGGRSEIVVWLITPEPEASFIKLSSTILREKRSNRNWHNATRDSESDTRFMDVHSYPWSDYILCVLVAGSDAFLRLFYFNKRTNHISLYDVKKGGDHCILRVTSLIVEGERVGVTTGADGRVRFWDLRRGELKLASTSPSIKQIHQSGINALSVSRRDVPPGQLLLATGGDDNTVSVCCFHVQRDSVGDMKLDRGVSWRSSNLHSSVVTGAEIVGNRIVFCGGDQRVTLVSWSLSNDTLSVHVLTQCCCSVPDIKGLTVLPTDKEDILVCVYGVGLEILELGHTDLQIDTGSKKIDNKTSSNSFV